MTRKELLSSTEGPGQPYMGGHDRDSNCQYHGYYRGPKLSG